MNAGDKIQVVLFSYKSRRHYGGRDIKTIKHTCRATYVAAQADMTHIVILDETCANYPKGHKIAVYPQDIYN